MAEDKIFVTDKEVVVPGETLAEGMSYLPGSGSYRLGDRILANRLGLLMIEGKVLKTLPLAGRYLPKRNDVIIGRCIDILMSGWRLEINSPYTAVLPLKDATFNYIEKGEDLTRYFELDDYLSVKVTNVTSQNLVDVSCKGPGLQKLKGGRIILVNTNKVPRIIGKRGSMVSMIKKATDCKIVVGQNGVVWISGEPGMEVIAFKTITMIEEKSHISGLTEKVRDYLEQLTGKKVEIEQVPEGADDQGFEGEEHYDNGSEGGAPREEYREDRGPRGPPRGPPRGGGPRGPPRGPPRRFDRR
jgi:exosome complex component RRP4